METLKPTAFRKDRNPETKNKWDLWRGSWSKEVSSPVQQPQAVKEGSGLQTGALSNE